MKIPALSRSARRLALLLLLALLVLNGLAYLHARAFTRFLAAGERTAPIEALRWTDKARLLLTGASIPKPANRFTPAALGLPYETHTFATTGGIRLEAWWIPRPDCRGLVLLFHGYTDAKSALLPEAAALHELGFCTFLVDFRGSGGSSGLETTLGYREAEDVAAAVAYASQLAAPRPLVLFGTSMGAAAVLKAVADGGARADRLVLESPFDRLLTAVRRRVALLGGPPFPLAHLLVFWGGVQQGFNGFRHDPVDYAAHVDVPALVLQGEADTRVRVEEARAVFDRLRGPKVFRLVPGGSHGSLLRADPASWKAAVREFLAAMPPPPATAPGR